MGHNLLGSELHWLPDKYLVKWWQDTPWGKEYSTKDNTHDFIRHAIVSRGAPTTVPGEWEVHYKIPEIIGSKNDTSANKLKIPGLHCYQVPQGGRIHRQRYIEEAYQNCSHLKEPIVDQLCNYVIKEHNKKSNQKLQSPIQYAQMIASLPVIRVTVIRDVWSWLLSKFFWHPNFYSRNSTLVVGPWKGEPSFATRSYNAQRKNETVPPLIKCDDIEEAAYGWGANWAMTYLSYLCGEHCLSGWISNQMTLDEIEGQGAYNLRHSFAVVGLLHKTNEFYEMVTHRVAYMNTSLNPEVEGKTHSTGNNPEMERCRTKYKDPDFQARLMEKSPEIAALERLYNIAVEVNEFQTKELAECSTQFTPT